LPHFSHFMALIIIAFEWPATPTKREPPLPETQSEPTTPIPAQSAQTYEDVSVAVNRGDYHTALRIVRPLADRGNPKAQRLLGLMYQEGYGLQRDYAEAMKWSRRAADRGDPWAQMAVGLMYQHGQGVPVDYVVAYMWLNLAAQSSEPADIPGHWTVAQLARTGRRTSRPK
jgi:hypothetical protein